MRPNTVKCFVMRTRCFLFTSGPFLTALLAREEVKKKREERQVKSEQRLDRAV
jgi:hypothetical protein